MIVKTKLSEQAEQFELDGVHYVGRRVLRPERATAVGRLLNVDTWADIFANVRIDDGEAVKQVLFRLDYDRGLIFVDPAILRPYQRPERKEEAGT